MRPQELFPLFLPIDALKGVGQRTALLLKKLCGPYSRDILFHLPISIVDRRFMPSLDKALSGEICTFLVKVDEHLPAPTRRTPYRVYTSNSTGFLELVFFNYHKDYLLKNLPLGQEVYVSGRVERFSNRVQILHPDYIVKKDEFKKLPFLESVYPLTKGVSNRQMIKFEKEALALLPTLPEWIEPSFLQKKSFPTFKTALENLHHPTEKEDPLFSKNKERLAYDEILANQLALKLVRLKMKKQKGTTLKGDSSLQKKLASRLTFSLTNAQKRVLREIYQDMESPFSMLRLLQGDVGSGKTIVALFSILKAIESSVQTAFLAPTDILVRQHFNTLTTLCEGLPLRIELLTGREKGKKREALLSDLKAGKINILIGTHALFQEEVSFKNLGLIVIDEQHRFGVNQRLQMSEKGISPDMLVMTATPIPRTLALTYYGDMDLSEIDELPPLRKKIETKVIPLTRVQELEHKLSHFLQSGNQLYWVCPLVEESQKTDLMAAEERFEKLQKLFPNQVGLIHGKMKGPEKDAVMEKFLKKELSILVATTVIEVGVDVQNATLMVIEHAERFGLSQLHQLRGRIGRGSEASQCLLLYAAPLSEVAEKRLQVMRETQNGFLIAEKDLELRGAGEVLGTRQSGMEVFKLADISIHRTLIPIARDDAQMIVNTDPKLQSERGKALRFLLYLFSKEEEIKTLRSG